MPNKERIAAAVMIGALIIIPVIRGIRTDDIMNEGIETVATVEKEGHKTLVISYYVGQNLRKATVSRPYQGFMSGEKYVMKYDKSNANNIVVLFWKPIFNKKTFVKIKPESISEATLIAGNVIVVEYTVKNTHTRRYIELPPKFDMDNISHLSLLYNPEIPEISYTDLLYSTYN